MLEQTRKKADKVKITILLNISQVLCDVSNKEKKEYV